MTTQNKSASKVVIAIFVILIVLFLGTIAIDRFAKRGARGG